MDPYYQDEQITLFHGDAFDVTPAIEAGSVDAVITDPHTTSAKHSGTTFPTIKNGTTSGLPRRLTRSNQRAHSGSFTRTRLF